MEHSILNMSGQFDLLVYTEETALCIDFKSGFREPDPAEINAQMKALAVLVALYLPKIREVIVQIVSGPYGVTEGRYSMADLASAYSHTLQVLEAIKAPDAPLSPSAESCRYCKALLICPAVRNQVVDPMSRTRLSEIPDGDRAATLLDQIETVLDLVKEIKAYYTRRLGEDPAYTIPGYGLVPGNYRREIVDIAAARSRLLEFIDSKDLDAASDFRLGELERVLAKKLKVKVPQAKEKLGLILDGLIKQTQNAPSLKRIK